MKAFRAKRVALAVAVELALNGVVVTVAEAKAFIRGDVGRAGGHIKKETKRGLKNLEEAGRVTLKTVERAAHAVGDAGEATGERIREGKFIDAAWHLYTDLYYKAQERIALQAMQESSALRMGAQVAITTFTGPAGAAAFSGWYVGRTTGDLGKGLKAATISYASSAATSSINAQPTHGFSDAAAKAMASGAVGCVATGASGGKCEHGVVNSAAASGLHSAYTWYTGRAPNGKAASEKSVAKTKDTDIRALRDTIDHVGISHANPSNPPTWGHEGSGPMHFVSQMARFNAGAYVHDLMVQDTNMPYLLNVATIGPTMVATHMALGTGRDAALLKAASEEQNN